MPNELKKFQTWADASSWNESTLVIQVSAYLQTYPGRVLQFMVELIEAAVSKEEQE